MGKWGQAGQASFRYEARNSNIEIRNKPKIQSKIIKTDAVASSRTVWRFFALDISICFEFRASDFASEKKPDQPDPCTHF
jgi:hypothetical protein